VSFATEQPVGVEDELRDRLLDITTRREWKVSVGRAYQTMDLSDLYPATYKRAFFLKLPAHTELHRHTDTGDCETEHFVLQSNAQCLNYWMEDGIEHSMHMEQGKRYKVNRRLMHWAHNDGETDRVHLLLEY
jgi:hypothetical protein